MSDYKMIAQDIPLDSNLPATFSRNIVNRFGIKSQKEVQRLLIPYYNHNQVEKTDQYHVLQKSNYFNTLQPNNSNSNEFKRIV